MKYCLPTSLHDGRCHLRSAVSGQLSVPHTTNYGDRSFAVSGPTVWNSLSAALPLDMCISLDINISDDINYNACNSQYGAFAVPVRICAMQMTLMILVSKSVI